MSENFDLNEDQRDCLQELMNVSYGSATAAISEILDSFATLNIPDIRFLPSSELENYFANQVNITYPKIFSSQLINGKLSGENIFVIDEKSANNVTKILNDEEEITQDDMLDVVLEITNILSSSTTSKFAELLSTEVSFSSPSIQIIHSSDKIDNTFVDNYDQVIIISTELKFESFDIHGELLILTKDASIVWMKEALDKVLEEF